MVALAVAVIAGVTDATRSVAAEAVVVTPLEHSWASLSPATLDSFEASVRKALPDFVWSAAVKPLLRVPGFAFFAGLALILYVIGRRPQRRVGGSILEN